MFSNICVPFLPLITSFCSLPLNTFLLQFFSFSTSTVTIILVSDNLFIQNYCPSFKCFISPLFLCIQYDYLNFSSMPQLHFSAIYVSQCFLFLYCIKIVYFFWITLLNYKNYTFIYLFSYMGFELYHPCIFIKFVCTLICAICFTTICTYYLELCFLMEFFIMILDSFLSLLYRWISIIPNNVYFLIHA